MHIYNLKYRENEKELCFMEMRHIFGVQRENYIISTIGIDVNKSPFIKECLDIEIIEDTLDEIVATIINKKISYENFKVKYVDFERNMDFEERHKIEGIVGFEIIGEADVHHPDIVLGITKVNNKWYFGCYSKSDNLCSLHDKKPYYYCNALTTKTSRAIVNIILGRRKNMKLIDPCCGIGTVVVEALSMGENIIGYDINDDIIRETKKNLKHFDMPEEKVKTGDIFKIKEKFDGLILDLPYGVLSKSSIEKQQDIIKAASDIAENMVIISLKNFDDYIKKLGFDIIDSCEDEKREGFKRIITLCKRK